MLIDQVKKAFAEICGGEPTTLVRAPGRVNLIGEHTDYNDGFVMPAAIDYQAVAAARRRDDGEVHVAAVNLGGDSDTFSLREPVVPHPDKVWCNYVRGEIHFVQKALEESGAVMGGADLVIAGDVPSGSGLSSSAALEVVSGQAMKSLYDLPLTPVQLARAGQAAEHEFVGTRCGIMDQMISACGRAGCAMMLDCRSLATTAVPIPPEARILIVNSNLKHSLVDSEYNDRRRQCEEAAATLGVAALRDADLAMLNDSSIEKGSEVYRRAHHVISENDRVPACAEALNRGDLQRAGELMYASHSSMRDDFSITIPEIDWLVERLASVIGTRGGARMTGGGFGGCCVALLPEELVEEAMAAVEKGYGEMAGVEASCYLCRAQDGAGEVLTVPV